MLPMTRSVRGATSGSPTPPPAVVLTNEAGSAIGTEDVVRAHQDGGRLHRAFSIFVFDGQGRTLLQRRSLAKRTFPGLWSNACCSHPRPGQDLLTAAQDRLRGEMGFTVSLEEVARFVYRALDEGSGLTEHEYDHVLVGTFDGEPRPDPAEASDWRWVEPEALRLDLSLTPAIYTPWLGPGLEALARAPGPSR
jgi:isopentenyl-diphosphate Delta-isomerase